MIGIFSGRGIADTARVHAQIDVDFRDHVHLFNNGRNLNPLGVFLVIALHADEDGWAYPGRHRLKTTTGISTEDALTSALAHLRAVRIDGHRIFAHYRERHPLSNRWGRSAYLIFPDLPHGPPPFENMIVFDPLSESDPVQGNHVLAQASRPIQGNPELDDPALDDPPPDDPEQEEEPIKEEGTVEEKPAKGRPSRFDPLGDLSGPAGPLTLTAHCEAARDKKGLGTFTVPPEAGGTDSLGEAMVAAWAAAQGLDFIPDKIRQKWGRAMGKMARHSGLMTAKRLTTAQAIEAVTTVLDPEGEFAFFVKGGVYTSPHVEKFKRDWLAVALRLANKGSEHDMAHRMGKPDRWEFDTS